MKRYTLLFFSLTYVFYSNAQPVNSGSIPLSRLYFHEAIDATRKKIMQSDKVSDEFFAPTANASLNNKLTTTLTNSVDGIREKIETDSQLDNNNKIKFLRGLNETLKAYLNACIYDSMPYSELPALIGAYGECMIRERDHESIESLISSYSYETGNILLHTVAFARNTGIDRCKEIVLLKYCDKYKQKALFVLSQHPELSFTDSLVAVIARRDPENLYTYAAASNRLATKIHQNPDTLVKVISRMSQMKTGRQLFPFLDNIYRGQISIEEVNIAMENEVTYYKLLVKTAIDYTDRMINLKDTALVLKTLEAKLQNKAVTPFINTINGLHDESDERIRFKILEPFSPEELYFMAVTGEEAVYTSSYVKGIYPRIWQRMKNPNSDSLLLNVKFSHFKKWIKMAANYNTLDDFLKRMDKSNAQLLMKAFVNGLDKTENLEDAVDVANSYASIQDSAIQQLILSQVQVNLRQAQNTHNQRATDIYSVLNTLFLSMDSSQKIDVSQTLGIPPVFFMPNTNLRDTAGRIVVQQFFYGDKDGQTVFNGFVNSFSNANWKVTTSAEWVSVASTRGVPVVIYANKPLDEAKGLDAKAQADLNNYLYDKDLYPTVVIHRGHSYWLPSTIDQLSSSAEVILLGSCGAYQSLDKILRICPTAQIVASKQTGSGLVNHPMIYTIMESLRQGNDLNWPQLWKTLAIRLGNNESFDDYIPPHKNLGALFLMAYKKKQQGRELASK